MLLGQMASLLRAAGSVGAMNYDARITLFNTQEEVNGILKHNESNRRTRSCPVFSAQRLALESALRHYVRRCSFPTDGQTMTPRRSLDKPWPTEAELAILQVLWERGACTVREVHEVLYGSDGAGYTTALKLMQIMHSKGLVERDDSQRAHVYRSAVSRQRTQKRFLADMVQRLFDGSPSQMVLHALGNHPGASREELREIRALLNKIELEGG